MEKLKLLGVGNEDGRSYFIFEKRLDFFSLFSLFLKKAGLEMSASFYNFQEGALTLDDVTDTYENVKNSAFDVDIFSGKDKIVVVIRSSMEREKYLPWLAEFVDF